MEPTATQNNPGAIPQVSPADERPPLNIASISAMVFLLILLIFAGTIGSTILNGVKTVTTLPAGQPLSGVISQSLGPNANGVLPVAGKDYKLSVKYFENNQWAVGYVVPLSNSFENSLVVLQKSNGVYRVVLQPTNALSANQLQGIPTDVVNYVSNSIAVYQPIPNQ